MAGTGDRLAGGGPSLRYSETCRDLMVCSDTDSSAAISADVRWMGASGSTQPGGGQRGRPGAAGPAPGQSPSSLV
jgi:hypothetical protein